MLLDCDLSCRMNTHIEQVIPLSTSPVHPHYKILASATIQQQPFLFPQSNPHSPLPTSILQDARHLQPYNTIAALIILTYLHHASPALRTRLFVKPVL